MTTNTEAEVAKALKFLAAEYRLAGKWHWAASLEAGDNAESEQYAINAIGAALRTASKGECAAHPGECSMGSHGPGCANQCKHCGNEATPASASDADWRVEQCRKYEQLRKIIDDGSESATHEDAVEWCQQHASASEAVYLVATGDACNHLPTYTRHTICPPMADAETLYLHPAPASAEPAYDKRDASGEGQEGGKDADDKFEDYVQNLIDKAPNTRELGERLARMLDEDDFNNVNPQLLALARMEAEQQRAGVLIDRDMAESVMQLLYLASKGRENIFAHTAGEIRDLLAATQPQEGAGNG